MPTGRCSPLKVAFFDFGFTLWNEQRAWASWAEWLGVQPLEFYAVLGSVIARGEHHHRAFEVFRPGIDLVQERRMRGEFGQSDEWNANGQLDWWLLEAGPYHKGCKRFVQDLNRLYLAEQALWKTDYDTSGFYWLDCSDNENSVLSFVRQDTGADRQLGVFEKTKNLVEVAKYINQQYLAGI